MVEGSVVRAKLFLTICKLFSKRDLSNFYVATDNDNGIASGFVQMTNSDVIAWVEFNDVFEELI